MYYCCTVDCIYKRNASLLRSHTQQQRLPPPYVSLFYYSSFLFSNIFQRFSYSIIQCILLLTKKQTNFFDDKKKKQTAQGKFAEIAEAYEVLSGDSSRRLYDHARRVRDAHAHGEGGPAGGNDRHGDAASFGESWGGAGTGGDWYFADGMDDAFGSSFGGVFGEAFGGGGDAFGGGGGEGTRNGGGGAGRGGVEFQARDPMELFEVRMFYFWENVLYVLYDIMLLLIVVFWFGLGRG